MADVDGVSVTVNHLRIYLNLSYSQSYLLYDAALTSRRL